MTFLECDAGKPTSDGSAPTRQCITTIVRCMSECAFRFQALVLVSNMLLRKENGFFVCPIVTNRLKMAARITNETVIPNKLC